MTTLNERLAPIDALREMLGDGYEGAVWADAQLHLDTAKEAYEMSRAFTKRAGINCIKRISDGTVFYTAVVTHDASNVRVTFSGRLPA